MKSVDVAAGTLQYREEGDPTGPPVVLLHGLLMNDAQWNLVLPLLPKGFRYLLPVLPLGGHQVPMRADADLTMPGMVGVVADFLDALELVDATLVVTDWGGALFLTDIGRDKRVGRLVICPSEAFGNFPPGLPGKITWVATRTSATVKLAMRQLRVGWLRRQWFMLGLMAKKPVPQDIADTWLTHGISDARVRRDLIKYCRTRFDKVDLVRATNRLADFHGQTLVLWTHNRVMPDTHAQQLAMLTGGRLRYIEDASVLVMLDQPQQTADAISEFLT
ncbi:alpha/beta hydrolase [Mycobacterium sp. MS1601]|uniref:alpha/beta fold hydrolase n=1 Tax=Mycobacterium sp. MS1601 TaxID=1936029 RepID=UPI0009791910|nr:alpha/beta hydrolase [Mycobacterium sp. MS1601]AQA05779.1 alpha/beta hydrolase [Mycobacterium sp. MS1601]